MMDNSFHRIERVKERGAMLLFGCALILFVLLVGTLGAFVLTLQTQDLAGESVIGAATEGITKDFRNRLQVVIDNNGGTLPPSYNVSSDLDDAKPIGAEIMSTSFSSSNIFVNQSTPTLTVESGDWDLEGSPACNPNCFSTSTNGDNVDAVRVEASFVIGPKFFFGESKSFITPFTKSTSVVVYFDQEMGTVGVVERN
ncbi:MAG: hypothetical protein R3A13_03005 [Bdellovibrionota bacterium]